VTYHVAVTNTSANGGVTVDQICDSAYGNIFTASTFTGASCPAGSVGSKTGTTCGALDIANGATGTCDFTANQAGPSEAAATLTVTNQLKVSGHSDLLTTKTFGPTLSNSVTVTSEESPSVATVTKGTVANLHACVTLRYSVDVANKSGADESLTLSALSDSAFGDITTVHGDVLATTCGGTAGTLPATLAVGGADYKCTFDAVICSDLPAGTTCFSHVNKVTGTISSEEAGDAVTQTGNTLTAQECVTLTPSSTTP